MAYHTLLYGFVFLPLCLIAYQMVPQRHRWKVLLAFSWLFFFIISRKLLIYLIGATVITHYTGVRLELLHAHEEKEKEEAAGRKKKEIRLKYQKRSRQVLSLGILMLLGVLIYLKYYNFFIHNIESIIDLSFLPFALHEKNLLLPVGISFYTLQAVGYMADVYWGKIRAEESLGRTALFLSFFPQIMEGPICRYTDTADTLYAGRALTWENLSEGYIRIFWGFFKKLIIADRLSVIVGEIFGNYMEYKGAVVAVGAVAYTVQLYMEFSGCMDMVIGSGQVFGIRLPENFRQPFCARSAAEFWRRWHISLGVWFKTYIFYPVSVSGIVKKWNSFGRKHAGKYLTRLVTSALALFPVWLCNGLWHGARWSYIFYGMYYFTLILAGMAVEPVRDRILALLHIHPDSFGWRTVQIAKTWLIIFTGELFFRADGLRAGLHMFRSIFDGFEIRQLWDGTLFGLGLERADFAVVAAGCIVVAVIGSLNERGLIPRIHSLRLSEPVKWCTFYALIFAVLIFAAYGDGYQAVDLIYAGF
ncbi:MAG TPA: MBOAT family protein [Candidatus Mediterraneibacter stercoripullorum]|nr:MBOAT family protein [Candidatus Mediterraneibacter stercoripullorum]